MNPTAFFKRMRWELPSLPGDPRSDGHPPTAPNHERLADRAARRATTVSDRALDFFVLAFASWTVIYHVCLIFRIGALWATIAAGISLVPCAWFATLATSRQRVAPITPPRLPRPLRRSTGWRLAHVAAAVAAAVLFGFSSAPWYVVWTFWFAAAAMSVTLALQRSTLETPSARPRVPGLAWPGTLAAFGWALVLAVLSLLMAGGGAGDDPYYVHLSSWVAAHHEFPLRDTMFTDQALPSVIYPPISGFEGLAGTVAWLTGISAPNVVYVLVPPLASALAALALWRLIRAWRIRMVAVALSAALVFLLLDAQSHRTLGNLFIGRIWLGKIVLAATLVPLIFALTTEYAQRPGCRQLVLLAAAGTAAVGLSNTGTFVAPVIAAGVFAPMVFSATRQAVAGFGALAAYPLVTGAVTLGVGGRHAQRYRDSDVAPERLVHFVLGEGMLGFLALASVVLAPLLIRRLIGAQTSSTSVLLVVCLYAPFVPLLLFHLTGLGQVLWRLTWGMPTAALVGVLAAAALARARPWPAPLLPFAILLAVLAAWGTPVWSSKDFVAPPSLKRSRGTLATARHILAHSEPGDLILAPDRAAQTILIVSGDVATVASRPFYARALEEVSGGHAHERLLLYSFALNGLGPVVKPVRGDIETVEEPAVIRSLKTLRVDVACVKNEAESAERVLKVAGYEPVYQGGEISCWRSGQ